MDAKDLKKEDLKAIFDQCMEALKHDDLDGANEFFTEEMKKQGQEGMTTPEMKAQSLQMAKSMIPITCQADHIEIDGQNATLYLSATLKDIFGSGEIIPQDIDILFSQESGAWKIGKISIHDHQDKSSLKRSPDLESEPKSNYDLTQTESITSAITSVKFEKDHTLVVMEMFDEEKLVFLPKKEDLEGFGLKAELLVPNNVLQLVGNPHKTNKNKVLASEAKII